MLASDETVIPATNEEITDYYAIGQCTPGAIAINVSTFIGYKIKGVLGAIATTLGSFRTTPFPFT